MSTFEVAFNTDDPQLRERLVEVDRMHPHDPVRLRVEAALCQWWANRALEKAGAYEALDRRERDVVERARATRERNRLNREGTR